MLPEADLVATAITTFLDPDYLGWCQIGARLTATPVH